MVNIKCPMEDHNFSSNYVDNDSIFVIYKVNSIFVIGSINFNNTIFYDYKIKTPDFVAVKTSSITFLIICYFIKRNVFLHVTFFKAF